MLLSLIGALALVIALAWAAFGAVEKSFDPDPVSIASASLEGLREQNRLTVFQASYNATITSTLKKLGLKARRTLIMPGTVRYEVDLAKLEAGDVRWDAESSTLSVRLPEVEVARPEVAIDRIQSYDDGGLLMRFTDAEDTLDAANRRRGVAELAKQARGPVPMRLARDSARRAVESSFALPLRAAGLDAKVEAFFPSERRGRNDTEWDLSRSIEDVLRERQGQ